MRLFSRVLPGEFAGWAMATCRDRKYTLEELAAIIGLERDPLEEEFAAWEIKLEVERDLARLKTRVAKAEKAKPPSREEPYYVASKHSTKFHLVSCRWAKRILQENKITFGTRAEASEAGYEPARDCIRLR